MQKTERKSCAKTQRGEEFSEFEELMGLIGCKALETAERDIR